MFTAVKFIYDSAPVTLPGPEKGAGFGAKFGAFGKSCAQGYGTGGGGRGRRRPGGSPFPMYPPE